MAVNVYPRAFSIHIDNPLNGAPTCTFQQEKVVDIDGDITRQNIGELKVAYDPSDVNAAQVYALLYNYYLQLITPPVIAEPEQVTEPTEEGIM